MSTLQDNQQGIHKDRTWWLNVIGLVLFWACYLWIQVPIPGVNEPHYLCKAKHFWQPEFCPRDFFLDSANTHFVFYSLFGWLTVWLPFPLVAFLGRAAGLILLASGLTSLIRRVSGIPWAPFGSALLFLGVTSWRNFSGEWIIGGMESKVFAYGCLLHAWSQAMDQRWNATAILSGIAISLHPVVGGWGFLAVLLAFVSLRWFDAGNRSQFSVVRLGRMFSMAVVCSLPGLIPALQALLTSVPDAAKADQLQVFRRLGHHLNPAQFPWEAYAVYSGILLVWIVLIWQSRLLSHQLSEDEPRLFARRFWLLIVLGSIVIAVAGLGVGWLREFSDVETLNRILTKLMKFYPFRLADVLLPWSTALLIIEFAQHQGQIKSGRAVMVGGLCLASGLLALGLEMPSRNVDGYSPPKTESWIQACEWVDQNLPADVLVITPSSSVTFRWYASRSAYVTFKDCPQDAAGILEWDRRLKVYRGWASRSFDDDRKYTRDELQELSDLTQATHLIVSRMGPIEREPIYQNSHYRIYDLPKPTQ